VQEILTPTVSWATTLVIALNSEIRCLFTYSIRTI